MSSSSPRVDALFARAVDEHLTEQRSWREALEYMDERLESLEETVGRLEGRLAKWSDPSEVADEVIGLEEEISMALARFHKRLETASDTIVAAASEAIAAQVAPLREELAALLEDLQALPEILAEHRDQIASEVNSRRARRQKD